MPLMPLLSSLVFSVALLVGPSLMAGETVGSYSQRIAPAPEFETALDLLNQPEVKEFLETTIMKKFRKSFGCQGSLFEKDPPTKKLSKNSLTCRDLISKDPKKNSLKNALERNKSLAQACKEECQKGDGKIPKGPAAQAAAARCLNQSCERKCQMTADLFKTDLESFVEGSIEAEGHNREALN